METKDIMAELDKDFNKMEAKDKAAKESGTLIGRYIAEPHADGYAHYEITHVYGDGTVRLKHLQIYDAWRSPLIEEMKHSFPLSYVLKNLKARDGIAAIFAEREANKHNHEKEGCKYLGNDAWDCGHLDNV